MKSLKQLENIILDPDAVYNAALVEALAALKLDVEELEDALLTALPFVEDRENDPVFKRGYVKKTEAKIRAALEKSDA